MAKHACGITKAEVIEDLPINTRQGRSRSLLSDDWERTGPIQHPMKWHPLKPSLSALRVGFGFRVCRDEARDFTFAHLANGLPVNHSRSRIA